MYGCESWTIKKAEHRRIDAFELRCWRRLLRVATLILWPPDAKSWLLWKDPDVGKDWRQEEKGTTEDGMVGWHHWFKVMSLSKLQFWVMDMEAWRGAVQGVAKSRTWLNDWTELCPWSVDCHENTQTILYMSNFLSNFWSYKYKLTQLLWGYHMTELVIHI